MLCLVRYAYKQIVNKISFELLAKILNTPTKKTDQFFQRLRNKVISSFTFNPREGYKRVIISVWTLILKELRNYR